MLNKNEIIKELKNKDFIARNAVYEYVCKLHLYDDKQINNSLIQFINENYKKINYSYLMYSKINKEIVNCLIRLLLNEKDEFIKESISDVLVNHYNLICNLDYDFEKILEGEANILLYKKIKHFSKKDVPSLLRMYLNNIKEYLKNEYYIRKEEDDASAVIRDALATALIQTIEGKDNILYYFHKLLEKHVKDKTISTIYDVHMTYLVYPLCSISSDEYSQVMLQLYIDNMDFLAYAEELNYYFSNIDNDKFVNYYFKVLNSLKKDELDSYYYDIAEHLTSDKVDELLYKQLNMTKDKEIYENILRILAARFNKDVIPYVFDYVKKYNGSYDVELALAVAPLFIIQKEKSSVAKQMIEEAKEEYAYLDNIEDDILNLFDEKTIENGLKNLNSFLLKDKEHIKEYKKTRELFDTITQDMLNYYQSGKFKTKKELDSKTDNLTLKDVYFDTSTPLGMNAIINILIYKNANNLPFITEEFIKLNKYRKEEKKEMLNSMLNSKMGLFEIIKTDMINGQVYLKNVLNGNEYCITDVALSSNFNNSDYYIYTRIITYNNICFTTGLFIPFFKEDEFIIKWIKDTKNETVKKEDLVYFIDLYELYIKNEDRVKISEKEV